MRDSEEADVILYNTCSIREHAEDKIWLLGAKFMFRRVLRCGILVPDYGRFITGDVMAVR